MSVVGSDFDELKQFNLAEIYDPTPKPKVEKGHPTPKPDTRQIQSPSTPIVGSINPAPLPGDTTIKDGALGSIELSVQDDSPASTIPNHLVDESKPTS